MHTLSATSWIEQDLLTVIKSRVKDTRKNSTGKLGLMAAFRHIRKQPKYTLLGDYPIISSVVTTLKKYNASPNRQNILNTMMLSKELKGRFAGKAELVKQLL